MLSKLDRIDVEMYYKSESCFIRLRYVQLVDTKFVVSNESEEFEG